MARMFVDKAESARMRLMMRYLGAAERAFYKASADLAKAQAERRKRAAEEAQNAAIAAMYASAAPAPAPAGGFVSHGAMKRTDTTVLLDGALLANASGSTLHASEHQL